MKKFSQVLVTIRNTLLLGTSLASFVGVLMRDGVIPTPKDLFGEGTDPLLLLLAAIFFLPPILCGEVGLFGLPRYLVLNPRPWARKPLVLQSVRLGVSLVAIVTMVVFAARLSPVYLAGISYASATAAAILGLLARRATVRREEES